MVDRYNTSLGRVLQSVFIPIPLGIHTLDIFDPCGALFDPRLRIRAVIRQSEGECSQRCLQPFRQILGALHADTHPVHIGMGAVIGVIIQGILCVPGIRILNIIGIGAEAQITDLQLYLTCHGSPCLRFFLYWLVFILSRVQQGQILIVSPGCLIRPIGGSVVASQKRLSIMPIDIAVAVYITYTEVI